jgi:hypothetical protein
MRGREELLEKTIVATVVRKVDEGPGGQRYIVVRSSAITVDAVVTVTQAEYDQLDAGMLVNVQRIGWRLFSTWRVIR